MIVVRAELWSAITGKHTELARMTIANDGMGNATRGNYNGATYRGRDKEALDLAMDAGTVTRRGDVRDYPRQALHVWYLVAAMLKSMNYGWSPKGE